MLGRPGGPRRSDRGLRAGAGDGGIHQGRSGVSRIDRTGARRTDPRLTFPEDRPIASPVTTWAESARPPAPDVFERLGRTILRLFTSVDFAVVQIIALSLLA